MLQVTLSHVKAAVLSEVLSGYLADLRGNRRNGLMQFREGLKSRERVLKKILEQLDTKLASPNASS